MTAIHLLREIKVPENRQRKSFPPSEEEKLIESIKNYGLLHPIIVSSTETPELIAGERRLRAMLALQREGTPFFCGGSEVSEGYIPCMVLADLTPFERMEVELEENVVRLDITWQEKAQAVENLRKLRIAQAEEQGVEPDLKKIHAEILGVSTEKALDPSSIIKDSSILVQHMHLPEVAEAKTKKEALKAIEKHKRREAIEEKAQAASTLKSKHKVLNSAFQDALLEEASFDCIICDPPYGVEANNFGSQPGVKHNYEDSVEVSDSVFLDLLELSAKWTKPQAHMYIFCSIDRLARLKELFDNMIFTPWELWPRPLIWDKGNGILPRPEHGPRYTYEAIMFFSRGGKRVTGVYPDVLRYRVDLDLMHGAQKPIALYSDLLVRSCTVGDSILDPTAGSGTIIPAADLNGCLATAIEVSAPYYNICLSRINPEKNSANMMEGLL